MVREPQDPRAALKLYSAMYCFGGFAETRDMVIVNWLETELLRLDKANRNEEVDAVLKQRQGACQVLEKILSMIAISFEKRNKLEVVVANFNKGGTG